MGCDVYGIGVTKADSPAAGDPDAAKAALAGAAHRLRTPLTAILGFADLLDLTDDPATIREYVGIIKSNAETLNEMLAELLDGPPPKRPRT